MALARFEVDMTRTFFRCLSLSSCVRRAFTTRSASDGSFPDIAPARAAVRLSTSSSISYQLGGGDNGEERGEEGRRDEPMRTTTNVLSSSTNSVIEANSLPTNFPDSENHREKSECELISTSFEWAYLHRGVRVRERGEGRRDGDGPVRETD